MLKWLRRRLTVLAICYVVLLGLIFIGGCADRLILFPTRDKMPTVGLNQLLIGQGDQQIQVWRQPVRIGAEPKAYVLSFNGNGDRAESSILRFGWEWQSMDVEVWAMNYPGYGGSAGSAHLSALTPAALRVYDEMKSTAGSRPIYLDANSIGTTVALSVAARRPVAGVVLTHPPALSQLILHEHGWWNLWLIAGPVAMTVPSDLDSVANAQHCTAPALIMISDGDTVVPVRYQKQVADAYAGPKTVLPISGNHNDPLPQDEKSEIRKIIQGMGDQATHPQPVAPGALAQ